MRIGIDIRLRNETGVGRYIQNLVKHLEALDKKNDYFLFVRGEEYLNLKSQISNLKWRIIKADVPWHGGREQILMPQLLKKEKLDLVHFPYFNVPIFYPGKFVVTIHDLIIDHFNTGRASTLYPLFYKLKRWGYKLTVENAVRRAEKVIVPSKATKSEVLEHYGVDSEKVVVIYEGTSDKLKAQGSRLRQGFGGQARLKVKTQKFKAFKPKQYFLYVGNAYPHKNLEKLLQAFQSIKCQVSSVRNTSQNLKLVLVGKEDFFYKRLKRKVREMGLEKEIIFTGYVSDEELSWLYQNAIALVLPSLMEGFSLPALEAMTSGCLVLASDIPALREVCREAAIYFKPEKEKELGDKLYKSYKNYKSYKTKAKLRKGLIRAGNFSWEKMARETLKVYESCFSL